MILYRITICNHSYSYRLCDLYDSADDKYKKLLAFEKVPYYKSDFNHPFKDYSDYYECPSEWDARSYGSIRTTTYKEVVTNYVEHRNADSKDLVED